MLAEPAMPAWRHGSPRDRPAAGTLGRTASIANAPHSALASDRVLLDTAVDAIVVSDADRRILRVNRAAATLFRHALKRMVGHDLGMPMDPDLAALHGGFMDHHLTTGSGGSSA